jgi:hypothetical protein
MESPPSGLILQGRSDRIPGKATSRKEAPPMGNFLLGVLMSTVGSLVADILKRIFKR